MRKGLWALLLIILPLASWAQGFVIDTFQVRIDLSRDGYFDVREDLFVTFSESKHGLYRDIPYRFAWNDSISGERAFNRGERGSVYETPIVNIDVPGYDFSTSNEGDFQKIKIGSSTKYVNGRVHYEIRYRVYGAINQFIGHDEFYWNLTGNGWKVNIEHTLFEVNLPAALSAGDANMRSWTGPVGSTTSGAVMTLKGSQLKGHCPSRLLPGHGATIGFSMPKGFLNVQPIPVGVLARDYSIRDWKSTWRLQENESWLVKEEFTVDIRNATASFVRTLPLEVSLALRENANTLFQSRGIQLLNSYELNQARSPLTFFKSNTTIQPQVEYYFINRGGAFSFAIEYLLWPGGVEETQSGKTHFWEPTGVWLTEPAEHAVFRIEVPGGIQSSDRFSFQRNGFGQQALAAKVINGALEFEVNNIHPAEVIEGRLVLPANRTHFEQPPPHIHCLEYFFRRYETVVQVHPDGKVNLNHDFTMVPTGLTGDYHEMLGLEYYTRGNLHAIPRYGLLRKNHRIDAHGFTPSDPSMAVTDLGDQMEFAWTLTADYLHKSKTGGSQVQLFDLLRRNGEGNWEISFPVLPTIPEPCDSFTLRLEVPSMAEELMSKVSGKVTLTYNDTLSGIAFPLVREGNAFVARNLPMHAYSGMHLFATLPGEAVSKSFGSQAKMLVRHNTFLLIPIVLFLVFVPIWFFKGRDKKGTLMVQFYPPEGMTPTEAGLLIDDKLHNRDLLSLFYYWAEQGIIKIETESVKGDSPKIVFVKLKELPKTARAYERTLFKGIFNSTFKSGNRVALQSLKYMFYDKMAKARKEVDNHARVNHFYVPGSKAWSGWMQFVGWIFFVFGMASLASLLFGFRWVEHGRWEVPLGYLLSWALMVFVGRKMVKRGPFGEKVFNHLAGFKEFIEKAEKDRLEKLLEKDNLYFERTLSYAIAFGMANKWVSKFNDLLATAPDWYQSSSNSSSMPFDAAKMNEELNRMLLTMSIQLNSTPPKTTGSGSTWTNSGSSSSSSSSSSYSGGGGSYSSGGYSGGGYGGGGGGSW